MVCTLTAIRYDPPMTSVTDYKPRENMETADRERHGESNTKQSHKRRRKDATLKFEGRDLSNALRLLDLNNPFTVQARLEAFQECLHNICSRAAFKPSHADQLRITNLLETTWKLLSKSPTFSTRGSIYTHAHHTIVVMYIARTGLTVTLPDSLQPAQLVPIIPVLRNRMPKRNACISFCSRIITHSEKKFKSYLGGCSEKDILIAVTENST
jgi:hypothetical protein